MKIQILEESGLAFSHLGGGLYECIKNRYEHDGLEKLYGTAEVSELFNNTTRVTIEQKEGDFLTNFKVQDRMKQVTKKIVVVELN